jgi:DNA-binding helix-hairpin-helix protein with protein kinase domain
VHASSDHHQPTAFKEFCRGLESPINLPGFPVSGIVGTPDYTAPEIVSTYRLVSREANLHALAVLLYQLIFLRHPLRGPKINSPISLEQDERLSLRKQALFIEHPTDRANRPEETLEKNISSFGPELEQCFLRAFVEGLHTPEKRPHPNEWQRALRSALSHAGRMTS